MSPLDQTIIHPPRVSDCFIIDPRRYKRDRYYTGILCFYVLFVSGIGILVTRAEELGWVFTGFAGLLLVPVIYTFLTWNHADRFQISPDGELTLHRGRKDYPPATFARDSTLELTIEHYQSRPQEDIDSTSTLNLWDTTTGSRRRFILGLWLAEEAKEEVLGELQAFLLHHGFDVKARNQVAEKRRR